MSVMLQPPPASQGHSALWLFAEEVLLKQTKGVWSRFTRCTPFILELCTFPAWVLQFWGHLGAGRIPSEAGAGEGCWRGRKDPGRGNCAWITKKRLDTHRWEGWGCSPSTPQSEEVLEPENYLGLDLSAKKSGWKFPLFNGKTIPRFKWETKSQPRKTPHS